ncbi:mucosa-associated lymphoid tissue lymphoma translocation protein 1 [Nematostella vectensis]|uniref:mucosa-associated lymphoid tissue lymphoma translocation protein 1 n=1 Tax=Nematostella vectensis TaxID=45351 RepID=UPI00139012AD|nr:mucosa-associated lymphoid tissue lymphoma translocation protein 1 [Nematostella vectensis]
MSAPVPNQNKMASLDDKSVFETPIQALPPEIIAELGMLLNPHLPCKDVRTLAGKMGYSYTKVLNFERRLCPTGALLQDWMTESDKEGRARTVSILVQMLAEMRRDDAVALLKPYIYTETPSTSKKITSSSSSEEIVETKAAVEMDFETNSNIPYDAPPEVALVSNVQNTIASSMSPNGYTTETRQAVGRHPASYSQSGGMTRSRTSQEDSPRSDQPAVSDKVALVIGNQNYECKKLQGLLHPLDDAAAVAKALWDLGFKVVSLVNLTLSEMRIAVLSFCKLLGNGVYAVLYYAGHGYEDGGENFLLPVDANLEYNREDSYCAQEILETMQTCKTLLNLLIIDSCRIRLPETDNRPLYVNRLPLGNNIFAYSCCTQQGAYEEPNQSNGLYAYHLLRHIKRDVRIEHLLMDVAKDVVFRANNRFIIQRPCHESDAVIDCRLTDRIQPNTQPDEYRERVDLWVKAHNLPKPLRILYRPDLVIDLHLEEIFANVMDIRMCAHNQTDETFQEFFMEFTVPTPAVVEEISLSGVDVFPRNTLHQIVRVWNLQKLQDTLKGELEVLYKVREDKKSFKLPVDLGCPLISSVFTEWDWWVTCGKLPPTKTTMV